MSESVTNGESDSFILETIRKLGHYEEYLRSQMQAIKDDPPLQTGSTHEVNYPEDHHCSRSAALMADHALKESSFEGVAQGRLWLERLAVRQDEDWRHRAACRPGLLPPDVHVNDFTDPPKGRKAQAVIKKICKGDALKHILPCPVKDTCLEYALAHGEKAGIWGGLNETERRKLKRSRP